MASIRQDFLLHTYEACGNKLPPELAHPFKIIALDWDGTAVMSRREDAALVRDLMDRLLSQGVVIVIITGTNFANIDRQLSAAIQGPQKRNLYILTNRGSEVYGFDASAQPMLLYRRVATPEEGRRLTEVADIVRDTVVAKTGLPIEVIYDRLNRRKIDLIPVPEWRDPPKSMIGELLKAVQARLQGAGLSGGIQTVFDLAGKIAREKGLTGARVTSDVKHIEVGLTDKSDAVDWMMRELAQKRGVPPSAILIAGDEFGPIAGFPGSDAKMLTPATRGAVVVSVGREPNGVPAGVLHLGGGPECFRALLADQLARYQERPLPDLEDAAASVSSRLALPVNPTDDPGWRVVEEGFTPTREHEIESLFAVANGYTGTRASLAEGSAFSKPATFVAGVFTIDLQVPIPEFAVMPDWTHLRVIVGGLDLRLEQREILEHQRELDLRQGIYWREWRHRDPAGRITSLRFLRLASLADRQILLQSVWLTPENYAGRVRLESTIPQSEFAGEPISSMVLESRSAPVARRDSGRERPSPAIACITVSTNRDITVAFARASQLWTESGRLIEPTTATGPGSYTERREWDAEIGLPVRLDRIVVAGTSRRGADPSQTVAGELDQILACGVESVLDAHRQAWADRWEDADLVVEGMRRATWLSALPSTTSLGSVFKGSPPAKGARRQGATSLGSSPHASHSVSPSAGTACSG
jgi:kojibiose phosphorylase